MASFNHDGVEIAYLDEGEGEPIVLVHGFASTKEVNWVNPGWVATLTRAGRRAIALDNRGHGESTKLYDPADYHTAMMAEDVRALLDHLEHRARRRDGLFDGRAHHRVPGDGASRAHALGDLRRARHQAGAWRRPAGERSPTGMEAPSLDDVTDPQSAACSAASREQTKSDLRALAACIRGSRQTLTREQVAAIKLPVLVAVGTEDDGGGLCRKNWRR